MTESVLRGPTAGITSSATVMMILLLVAAVLPVTGWQPASLPAQAATSDQGKQPIKIGYIVPLSGQSAEAGHRIVDGMNLYLDEIHHQMGGRPVQLIVESDESSPPTAKAKVKKLVEQDKVNLLSGMYLSSCLYAIAPSVEQYQIPFVVVSAGANDVTQRKRNRWIIRTCYTSTICAHPMAEYAYKKLGYKRVVVIASDYAYGYEAAGGFQQTFEELGGQVVQKLWAPLGFTDFTPLLKQIRKDADAVYLANAGQSCEIIPKQFKQLGIRLPLVGVLANFDESFYPRMGDELVGGVSTSLYSTALNTPANKRFVKAFEDKYNSDASYYSEHGYTAMMFIHKAIDSLKGQVDDKEKLLAALKATELKQTPRGPLKIDDYGSATVNIYVRKTERQHGKLQNTVIFTYPNVSQFWKYPPEEYLKQPSYSKEYPPCTHCASSGPT
ncbi:MAG TPA: penicillin-binding protein activator [Candidatus Obscuribacterales bacterium]